MAKLVLSMDGLVLKEISLTKERISIGRKPHNDIQIDNLAISGEHAVIVTILDDSFLEDLNSTNGTMVNGRPIKKHCLRHNDLVELGKYKLKYLTDIPSDDLGTSSQPTSESQLGDAPLFLSDAIVEPKNRNSVPGKTGGASIHILNGSNAGKTLPLIKAVTSVGKPGVQVAIISKDAQGYLLTHMEGASFPIVNQQSLGTKAYLLKNKDLIEISGVKMEFLLTL